MDPVSGPTWLCRLYPSMPVPPWRGITYHYLFLLFAHSRNPTRRF